jgi:hypothetical protein
MEDVSDLTLDDSKPAATITVHNNEYKVPKREPSKTKHKGNDGMNAWWMGLAKGAKQKLFPLLSEEELPKKTTPPSWNVVPRWSRETTSF